MALRWRKRKQKRTRYRYTRLQMTLNIPKTSPTLSVSSTFPLQRMAQYEGASCTSSTDSQRMGSCFSKRFHIKLSHPTQGSYMFGFHDNEDLGRAILSRIAKRTGLTSEDL